MKTIISHPTGNRNVRAVVAALADSGQLGSFHGALALGSSARWPGLLPRRLRGELERRRYDLPDDIVHAHPWREIVRLVAARLRLKGLVAHERGWASVDRVYTGLDRAVAAGLLANGTAQAVYAYEDGALATFTRAKELGMARVYDLPIAYWETGRRLMIEEAARLPAWAATLGGGVKDSPGKIARKTRELELADLVVTPSQFVADSLPEWARASKRVVVAPFGSPPATQAWCGTTERQRDGGAAAAEPRGGTDSGARECRNDGATVASKARTEGGTTEGQSGGFRPSGLRSSDPLAFQSSDHPASTKRLRVLFAGSMGQRKGLGDLFVAMRLLNRDDIELVVMGSLQAPMEFYRSEFPDFTYEPGRPHAQVLELMHSCDVFCLPSIVEGRALVMQEAMSQGLPIIITPNTGGADLVCEAHEGGTTVATEPHGGSERRNGGTAEDRNDRATERRSVGFRPSGLWPSDPLTSEPPAIRPSGLLIYGRSATGFLVPIRSPEAIAEAIAWCADHRAETSAMGRAARLKAATYTWATYGQTVVTAIEQCVKLLNVPTPC